MPQILGLGLNVHALTAWWEGVWCVEHLGPDGCSHTCWVVAKWGVHAGVHAVFTQYTTAGRVSPQCAKCIASRIPVDCKRSSQNFTRSWQTTCLAGNPTLLPLRLSTAIVWSSLVPPPLLRLLLAHLVQRQLTLLTTLQVLTPPQLDTTLAGVSIKLRNVVSMLATISALVALLVVTLTAVDLREEMGRQRLWKRSETWERLWRGQVGWADGQADGQRGRWAGRWGQTWRLTGTRETDTSCTG